MNPTKSLTRALGCSIFALLAITVACTDEEQALVAANAASPQASLASTRSQNSLTDDQLAHLANCESGGNPAAVSRSGSYLGLYQFNQSTWNSTAQSVMPEYVGVSPAAAPPEIQNAMARALYAARGRSPWPVCGRRL